MNLLQNLVGRQIVNSHLSTKEKCYLNLVLSKGFYILSFFCLKYFFYLLFLFPMVFLSAFSFPKGFSICFFFSQGFFYLLFLFPRVFFLQKEKAYMNLLIKAE